MTIATIWTIAERSSCRTSNNMPMPERKHASASNSKFTRFKAYDDTQKNAHMTSSIAPKTYRGAKSFISFEKHASTAMNRWKKVMSIISL